MDRQLKCVACCLLDAGRIKHDREFNLQTRRMLDCVRKNKNYITFIHKIHYNYYFDLFLFYRI